MGYQVGIMNLEFIEFGISRGERSNKEVKKYLRIRIVNLFQSFVAREMLTKL
jgi:hypothetical protein